MLTPHVCGKAYYGTRTVINTETPLRELGRTHQVVRVRTDNSASRFILRENPVRAREEYRESISHTHPFPPPSAIAYVTLSSPSHSSFELVFDFKK